MLTVTSIKRFALGTDLKRNRVEEIKKSGLLVLNSVSISLVVVSLIFLVAFHLNNSVSLTWFFFCEAFAFVLIPILARKGYENTSKFMLIAYVDIGIIILSAVFGKAMLIQTFFVPACGLSILLFDKSKAKLRNLGVFMSGMSYFVLDYIIFDQIYFSSEEYWLVKWSILAAAFISTWMIFNSFSESKDKAEEETNKLLEEQQTLNEELEKNLLELEDAKRRVEEGSKAKTDFLSTMSHEIRTPMNAIIGMTNLLSQDNPRTDQLEQLEILDFSAKTLLALINDVLDFSKIESGKIDFEEVDFDLNHLIRGIIESFRFSTKKKNIYLEADIEEGLPEVIRGDSARLTQILNNLVSNAVKFTDTGGVTIRVKSVARDGQDITLQFQVKDTGVGIAKDKHKAIFDSFTQERTDTTRVFGGTGLGLTISKNLIELQGGQIFLESEKHKGSTFFVDMKFQIGEGKAQNLSPSTGEWELHSLEGISVLLVEDNPINQKVMQKFLDRWEMRIEIANNGLEAVEYIEKKNYHLVLMDLQMPVMDGYEATRRIRMMDESRKRNIPIIALTAAALKEVKEKVYASGMNDFITKPFNPNELQDKMEQHVLKELRESR